MLTVSDARSQKLKPTVDNSDNTKLGAILEYTYWRKGFPYYNTFSYSFKDKVDGLQPII